MFRNDHEGVSGRIGWDSQHAEARGNYVSSVNYHRHLHLRIPPDQSRREREKSDRKQEESIQPEKWPVDLRNIVKHAMVAYPEDSQQQEAENVAYNVRPQSHDVSDNFGRQFGACHTTRDDRDAEAENQNCHHGCKDPVRERFQSPLAKTWNAGLVQTHFSYTRILSSSGRV